MRRIGLSLSLLLLCCGTAGGAWEPWETTAKAEAQTRGSTEIDPLQQLVRFFQQNISAVDGARCPMYPTCSGYSSLALRKHGALIGMMMTVDRLYRESDPLERQDKIVKWGVTRFFDPLEKNDFWWDRPDGGGD
jgi:putative component of membrane protein insertase Oxa1/YidC/SpoIIIJ protein YidD